MTFTVCYYCNLPANHLSYLPW